MTDYKKILFVCVENAGRSQMAEAFFRKYAPLEFVPISAGTKPVSKINPIVVQAMKEVGIELQNNIPKSLSNEMISNSTKIINMGCVDKESCPSLFVNEMDDWKIPDPKGKSIEEIRKIRDEIDHKIKQLVLNLRDEIS